MSLKSQMIRATLESMETPLAPIGDNSVSDIVIEDSVRDNNQDLQEGLNQVDQAEVALTQMHTALESLESLHALMVEAHSNGGLTADASVFAQCAMESTLNGLELPVIELPSMESFTDSVSKAKSTVLSMEGVSEQLKKLWEMVKVALSKAAEFLSNVFERIFGETSRLESTAKTLQAAAKAADGYVKKKGLVINQPYLVRYLHDSKNFVETVALMNTIVGQAVHYDQASGEVLSNAASKLSSVLWGKEDPFEITETPPPPLFKKRVSESKDGGATVETETLPGGKIFCMSAPIQGSSLRYFKTWQSEGRNIKFSVYSRMDPKHEAPDTISLPVMTLSQIEDVATHALALVASVRNAKTVIDEASKRVKLLKETVGQDGRSEISANTVWFRYYQARVAGNGKASALISSHAIAVTNAILVFANLSLKQYTVD